MKNESFVSSVFFRSKSDGTSRPIVNLKKPNGFLEDKNTLKTVTVHLVADLIQPRCYMISIALKDA